RPAPCAYDTRGRPALWRARQVGGACANFRRPRTYFRRRAGARGSDLRARHAHRHRRSQRGQRTNRRAGLHRRNSKRRMKPNQDHNMNTPNQTKTHELLPGSPAESALSSNIDRRSFLIRNAVIGAAAVMTGRNWTPEARAAQAEKEAGAKLGSAMSPDLDVVKKSKGPVMTILEEFYKVGPGPSSSHTIG